MGLPRISYGSSVTIDLPAPSVFSMKPRPPASVNTTMTGLREYVVTPRVEIPVHIEFPVTKTSTTTQLPKITNWYQHACRGGTWSFALDSAKVVDTTLNGSASSGATSLIVTSATGIVSGQIYKIIDGAYYQELIVSGIASNTISFATTPLNTDIASGAIFRDQYFFQGEIGENPEYPIILWDAGLDTWPATRPFRLMLDFIEKVA